MDTGRSLHGLDDFSHDIRFVRGCKKTIVWGAERIAMW
jgi:hypothetical protein